MESGDAISGVDIGPQFVTGDFPARHLLNWQNLFCGNAALALQPLPDHALGNTKPAGELRLAKPFGTQIASEVHCELIARLLPYVNSTLIADLIAELQHPGVKPKKPRPGEGVPKEVAKQEGKALKALWTTRRVRTQEKFAGELGITQGNIPQYFAGIRPLHAQVALAFAKELKCSVSDFSPRLAKEIAKQPPDWPFKQISRERYFSLTEGQRIAIEGKVLGDIVDIENAALKK